MQCIDVNFVSSKQDVGHHTLLMD